MLTAKCTLQILLLIGIASACARAETIDRVLAVVAGQLITLSDVTAAADLGLQAADGAADPVRAVLSKLIDRELILAEVDRYAPAEPAADEVDREVERVRGRFTFFDQEGSGYQSQSGPPGGPSKPPIRSTTLFTSS